MSSPNLPLVGLMLGDATGIGPEISAKVLASRGMSEVGADLVVIGDVRVLQLGMRDAAASSSLSTCISASNDVPWPSESIPVVDLANVDPAHLGRGEISDESGRRVR